MGLTEFPAPHHSHNDKDQKYHQQNEALLRSRADPHDSGRTFQFAGLFEIFVEDNDPDSGDHERKDQEVQHSSMPRPRQETNPQNGDDAHDERPLVETKRASLEAHPHAQPQAPR